MAVTILMPALSPTMKEGKLSRWLVKDGDSIEPGQVIAEIETDKATMEVEAVEEGVVAAILVPADTDNVKIQTPIAILATEGESLKDVRDKSRATPENKEPPAPSSNVAEDSAVTDSGGEEQSLDHSPPLAPIPRSNKNTSRARESGAKERSATEEGVLPSRIFASPLARRLAAPHSLDLSVIKGSGPRGRVVKVDVERVLQVKSQVKTLSTSTASIDAVDKKIPYRPTPFEPAFESVAITSMRRVVADRLTLSKQTIPHFYLSVDVDLDRSLSARKYLNARSDDAYKISVNDMVLRAVAVALRQVPEANVAWSESAIKVYKTVDIAVAVAIKSGLITPIIRDADHKSLIEISNEMKHLIAKARSGKLTLQDYQGGTVSVSNLGMFGIKQFNAIINPPQACLFAVGAGVDTPVVKKGKVTTATVMQVTLCADHRVIDGAVAAQLVSSVKNILEEPIALTV